MASSNDVPPPDKPTHPPQPVNTEDEPTAKRAKKSEAELLEDGIKMLMAKGVFQYKPTHTKEMLFNSLRNDLDMEPARERLLNLMHQQHDNELKPEDLHKFTREEFPGDWKLYMIDSPETLVQRHQRSGLCYLHAPIVAQYYAVWKTKLKQRGENPATKIPNETEHAMIDLTAFILKYFEPKALENYIFQDNGGFSHDALERILQPGSILENYHVTNAPKFLAEHGPALVSNFAVYDDFRDQSIHKHYGKPMGKKIGGHAMVLVGTRTDSNNKLYLLLQNWWLKKQFVEVDVDYFKACGASLWFVATPQTQVPDTFPTHKGHFLQTECLQLMERVCEM